MLPDPGVPEFPVRLLHFNFRFSRGARRHWGDWRRGPRGGHLGALSLVWTPFLLCRKWMPWLAFGNKNSRPGSSIKDPRSSFSMFLFQGHG